MKGEDVQVGQAYIVKVSNRLSPVRVDAVSEVKGWEGTNLATGKKVFIKGAGRFRQALTKEEVWSAVLKG